MATTKQLTEIIEAQAAMIEALEARVSELEQARVGMRAWAEKVQARLTNKPVKAQSDWVSGYRPVRTTPRRPVAPAAAAAEAPPEEAPPEEAPPEKDLGDWVAAHADEDCPF